jgi:phosphoribosylglycinamide formyltransferase-1
MIETPLRIAVLASGGGTNFQAIQGRIAGGRLNAQVVLVISNNKDAYVLERARTAGIRTEHWSEKKAGSREAFVAGLLKLLEETRTELIVLAGYMKLIPAEVVKAYAGSIINIHPALLPKFGGQGMYGIHVHEAVLAAGEKESGASVHLVDAEYDRGTILKQRKVPVLPGDTPETLRDRVLDVEHELYSEVIAEFAANRQRP